MSDNESSANSLRSASENKAASSKHGRGAAGFKQKRHHQSDVSRTLEKPEEGFGKVSVGLGWHNTVFVQPEGMFNNLFGSKKKKQVGVDLDLGCLYQLKDDTRGCLQGFGELYGSYDQPPFIHHSGDERTGDTEGHDERLEINGAKWDEIERLVIYTYIYEGPQQWADIQPEIEMMLPGDETIKYRLDTYQDSLPLYCFLLLENKDGDMRIHDVAEYFSGHAELSRAFGFGLRWEEGEKA